MKDNNNNNDYESRKKAHILAEAYHYIGYTHARFEKYREAIDAYSRSISYRREAGLRSGWAATLNDISFVYSELGELRRARRFCEHGLEMREEIGHEYFIGLSQNTLGLICLKENRPREAQKHCANALKLFEKQNDRRGIGLACNALGQTFRRFGASTDDLAEAENAFKQGEECLKRSITIFTEREETPRLIEAYDELGCLYRDWGTMLKGRRKEARSFVDKAEENILLAIELTPADMLADRADFLEDLAEVHVWREDFTEAKEVLAELDSIIPDDHKILPGKGIADIPEPVAGFWGALGKGHLLRGAMAYAQGEYKEAAKHYMIAGAYFEHRAKEDKTALEYTIGHVYDKFKVLKYKDLREVRDYAWDILKQYRVQRYRKIFEAIEDTLGIPKDLAIP